MESWSTDVTNYDSLRRKLPPRQGQADERATDEQDPPAARQELDSIVACLPYRVGSILRRGTKTGWQLSYPETTLAACDDPR